LCISSAIASHLSVFKTAPLSKQKFGNLTIAVITTLEQAEIMLIIYEGSSNIQCIDGDGVFLTNSARIVISAKKNHDKSTNLVALINFMCKFKN
jgi:hypothetical protein